MIVKNTVYEKSDEIMKRDSSQKFLFETISPLPK